MTGLAGLGGLPVCSAADRAAWLEARKGGIGASEIAQVMGWSLFGSALSLYAAKVGAAPPLEDSEALEWGRRLEPAIVEAFSDKSGLMATPCGMLLRSPVHPWALATPDAAVLFADGTTGPLQAKSSGAFRTGDWDDGVPAYYNAQVQWELYVTGAARGAIACLFGGQRFAWQLVERDEVLIRGMVAAGAAFWRCVETRTPPAADGSEHSRAALAALYPADDGSTVALDGTLAEVADALAEAKAAEREAKAAAMAAENHIKEAIGNATHGTLADGRVFTWKRQHREGYTVAPTDYRVLRLHAPKE